MPEIATVAGVGRTTLHRYFADRETLIHEAERCRPPDPGGGARHEGHGGSCLHVGSFG